MRHAGTLGFCLALALGVSACGGDDDADNGNPTTATGFRVTIASPDQLAAGPSRFIFALDDAQGAPVTNARAHLRFFFIDPKADNRPTIKNAVDATPVSLERSYEVTLEDGGTRVLGPGDIGIYANDIAFDQPGDWRVEITGDAGTGNLGIIEVPFVVTQDKLGLQPGSPALPSTEEIDAALSSGRAVVVTFGNEDRCLSSVCGALVETARELEAGYGAGAEFLFFGLEAAPEWVAADWGVGEDAAVFFIDGSGTVRARVQTVAAYAHLETHIAALVAD